MGDARRTIVLTAFPNAVYPFNHTLKSLLGRPWSRLTLLVKALVDNTATLWY
jgi:hypothetical protein